MTKILELINVTIAIYTVVYSIKPICSILNNYLDNDYLLKSRDDRILLLITSTIVSLIFITTTFVMNNQENNLVAKFALSIGTLCNIGFAVLLHLFQISSNNRRVIVSEAYFPKPNNLTDLKSNVEPDFFLSEHTLVRIEKSNLKLRHIKEDKIKVDENTICKLHLLNSFTSDFNRLKKAFCELREIKFMSDKNELVNKNKTAFVMLLIVLENMNIFHNMQERRLMTKLVIAAEKLLGVELGKSKAHYYDCRDKYLNNRSTSGQKKIAKFYEKALADI